MPLPADKLPSRGPSASNDEQSTRWPRESTTQPESQRPTKCACAEPKGPTPMQSGKCKRPRRFAPEQPGPAAFPVEKVGHKTAVLPIPADLAQAKSPRSFLRQPVPGEIAKKSNPSHASTPESARFAPAG